MAVRVPTRHRGRGAADCFPPGHGGRGRVGAERPPRLSSRGGPARARAPRRPAATSLTPRPRFGLRFLLEPRTFDVRPSTLARSNLEPLNPRTLEPSNLTQE